MNLNREKRELITDKVSKSDLDKNRQSLINSIKENSNFVQLVSIKKINFKILTLLNPIVAELCNCLSVNAYQASITLTNHLLEKALKTAIIFDEGRVKVNDNSLRLDEVFKEAYDRYDGIDMDKAINKCCRIGLINKEEKLKLMELKRDFRNPYSHAEAKTILNNITSNVAVGYLDKYKEAEMQTLNVSMVPILHGEAQLAVAKKYGFEYFKTAIYIIVLMDCELERRYKQ